MNEKLKQGKAALNAGDRQTARKLLYQAAKEDPNNESAWQLLYNVCDNDTERVHCLQQVLRINPINHKAHQLLATLAVPAAVEPIPTTITCPYCKSQIHSEAIICPHCRKDPRPSMVIAESMQKAGCSLALLPFVIGGLVISALGLWCLISVMLGG